MNTRCLLSLLVLLALASCSPAKKNHFLAEGTITGASGQTLYLEETNADEPRLLDSVRLGDDGHFSFSAPGATYPSFYRLRLGEGFIPFTADSVTKLSLTAKASDLFGTYEQTEADEANKQIRAISRLRWETDKKIEGILQARHTGALSNPSARSSIDSLVAGLKKALTERYIFADPKSPAAYYALFQTYRGGAYFTIDEPGDERAFAAVATAYEAYYPTAPYLALLRQAALRSLSISRARYREAHPDTTTLQGVEVVSFPEIRLKDQHGKLRSLTQEVAQGRPTLLCFTSYAADWSPELVAELRRLQGLHPNLLIYEVSVDADGYLWKNATRNIPWISTQDLSGEVARLYNVQRLPAFFSLSPSELHRLSDPADLFR